VGVTLDKLWEVLYKLFSSEHKRRGEHMAEDPKFDRIAPKNFREYLKDFKRSLGIYKWVWDNMISVESKKWAKHKFIPLAVLAIAIGTSQPFILSKVFDGLVTKNLSLIVLGVVVYSVILYAERWTMYFQQIAREWMLGLNYGSVDKKVTELMFEKSMGQHLQESAVLNVSNIDKGKWKTLDVQAMLLFEGIPSIATLLFVYIGIWIISWVAGVIISVVVFTYIIWSLYLNQKVMQQILPIDKELRSLNRYRYERWEKAERVKVSGRSGDELKYMTDRFNAVIKEDRNFWLWYIKQSRLKGAVRDMGVLCAMLYGIWLVWIGSWSVGLLYPLFAWTGQFKNNLWRVSEVEHQLNWHMPAVKAMIDAVTLPPAIKERKNALTIKGHDHPGVEFRSVSYVYPAGNTEQGLAHIKSNHHALVDINFTIEPGQKVALIGESGAGKSTIMRLLLRYMDPDGGEILVGGVNLQNIELNSWTRYHAYIAQDPKIFDGTIEYNLTYGLSQDEKDRLTRENLWQIMQDFRVDFRDFRSRKDKGLDVRVGRGGIELSGGEKQRLMIAAAAIQNPKLLVVDEATSSLDSTIERQVQEGLTKVLSGRRSAFIVAHRLSTVREICDKFIVLRSPNEVLEGESQIEAQAGSFEELYGSSPTFRRLADDQRLVL